MPKVPPGLVTNFKGLWVRGHIDSCPPDHFIDAQNNCFVKNGVGSRDCLTQFSNIPDIVSSVLYKPNPPFTATKRPRLLILNSSGQLFDTLTGGLIASSAAWKYISGVNFFGRIYLSPNDGLTGIAGEAIYVYDGVGFRIAGGSAPTIAMTAAPIAGTGLETGTYLFAYAFETPSGFITAPSPRSVVAFVLPTNALNITNLPVGPAGTTARWVIATKLVPNSTVPPFGTTYNGNDTGYPFYFATRVADNTTTALVLDFFEENLLDSADYLFTNLVNIPAGVGLLDYKGRMVSWGEAADPTLVRVSAPGDPETFSSTSGFLITDPPDNTGVRNCTEWQNNLYICKRQRVYVTEDNGGEASTWTPPIGFEKALGTEHEGIAAITDAKGSSQFGFIMAALPGLYIFNGAFIEPELSYKIKDLWLRINPWYFHLTKVVQDPEQKRIYILVALDNSAVLNAILFADYRDGLNWNQIKWDIWRFYGDLRDLQIYEEYVSGWPELYTIIITNNKMYKLNIGSFGTDDGVVINSYFILGPQRFGTGVSQFNGVKFRATGPCTLHSTLYGQDLVESFNIADISIASNKPGKEFAEWANLVSEQGFLKVSITGGTYGVNATQILGSELWTERPSND